MPDFAPNYTARIKLRYSVAGATHTMQWRAPSSIGAGDVPDYVAKMETFLNDLEAKLFADFVILGTTYALADSDVFLPTDSPTGIAGTVSTSGRSPSQKAWAISFVGRSANGGRAEFFLYGIALNPVTVTSPNDFRIHSTEDSDISTAIGVLDDTPPDLAANDDGLVTWYEYVNAKYNDYWTRRLRSGG